MTGVGNIQEKTTDIVPVFTVSRKILNNYRTDYRIRIVINIAKGSPENYEIIRTGTNILDRPWKASWQGEWLFKLNS